MNFRIVENEAWHMPFMVATSAVNSRREEPALSHLRRKRRVVNLLARLTPEGQSAMFVDANWLFDDLDLLDDSRRFVAGQQGVAAHGAFTQVVLPCGVKHVRRKLRTLVFRMPRLSALLPFPTSTFAFRLLRLDNITRRRFRRSRRIFAGLGQFLLQFGVARLQLRVLAR